MWLKSKQANDISLNFYHCLTTRPHFSQFYLPPPPPPHFCPFSNLFFNNLKVTNIISWYIASNYTILDVFNWFVSRKIFVSWSDVFFVAAILDFSTAILQIGQFWLAKDKYSNYSCSWTFYQVSCLYLHVPSFCHFPLCLTYEFGSHLEISVSHLKNGKICDG